jgi:cytochrome c-type biogenesis protein
MTPLIAAAFAAGMVATVNPCGFAMFPAYLGLILGERRQGASSALAVGGLVSVGFVAVFVASGILVSAGLRAVISWIPWLAAVVGVGLVGFGVAQLRGRHPFARLPGVCGRANRGSSPLGLVAFGVSYGIASLSCTLPIFISLVAGTVTTGSLGEAALVFGAYGLGMSLVVIVVTLVVSAGRDRVVAAIRPLSARLSTISGWVMIAAGAFIVWYWGTVLATDATNLGANPAVRAIERLTAQLAGAVAANPLVSALLVLLLGLVTWMLIRVPDEPEEARADDLVETNEGSG